MLPLLNFASVTLCSSITFPELEKEERKLTRRVVDSVVHHFPLLCFLLRFLPFSIQEVGGAVEVDTQPFCCPRLLLQLAS